MSRKVSKRGSLYIQRSNVAVRKARQANCEHLFEPDPARYLHRDALRCSKCGFQTTEKELNPK